LKPVITPPNANKIDTISPADLEAYQGYCHNRLCQIMAADAIELFAISVKTKVGMAELLNQKIDEPKAFLSKAVVERESATLKQELSELVNRVIANKEAATTKQLGNKICELDESCQCLTMLLKEL
jgi:hypothetical protein